MRTQTMVMAFYATDALLMAGYAWQGVLPFAVAVGFGLAGCGLTALFAFALHRGWHRRMGGARFTTAQVLSTCALKLGTAALAPHIGVLLLLTIVVALSTAALQMQRRHVLAVTMLIALGAGLLMAMQGADLSMPLATPATRALSGLWFAIVAAKIAFIHMIGAQLRAALSASNQRLSLVLTQVQALSEHDELTGLPNRRSMMASLANEIARFDRGGPPFAVALLDLDHFKRVNDRFGHAMGDEVLKAFAQRASSVLRGTDILARHGGEEFLLLLPGSGDLAAATVVAERVRRAVQAHDWAALEPSLTVTCSIGLTLCRPGDTVAPLLARADAALYCAKAGGRNAVCTDPEAGRADPVGAPGDARTASGLDSRSIVG